MRGTPRPHEVRIPVTDGERAEITAAAGDTPVATWARALLLAQARRLNAGLPVNLDARPAEDPVRATERALDAALAEVPRLSDPAIAERLELTVDVVRRHREAAGIEAAPGQAFGTAWEGPIREAHARGLLTREIAEATGYTVRTVQQRLSQLRLKANKSRNPGQRRG